MNVLGKWDYGQSNNHPVLKRENQDKNWIKKKGKTERETESPASAKWRWAMVDV
jgi:hypothetical protein